MDTLLSAAHLRRELGEDLFNTLVDPENTKRVREFGKKLLRSGLPTGMTLGGVPFDILGLFQGDEESVKRDLIVARAKEVSAHNGEKEFDYLIKHQNDIPVAFRGKITFVFTDAPSQGEPGYVLSLHWGTDLWVARWLWLDRGWFDDYRVLRRKSA